MKEIHEERGGLFGAGYVLDEIKVNWISSDAPNAQEIKERYEGWTIGEIAAREGKHPIDAMLDIAVAGDLKVGFATKMLETPPEAMKEIATSPVALPGVSDGGAHTKFVTTARYPTELLSYWVREHEIMSLEEAHWRLSYYPAVAAGLKDRGFLREGAPADVIVYDYERLDSGPQERLWDYPAGEMRLVQKATGLRAHHRQRRHHVHRRRMHRRDAGPPAAPRNATEESDDGERTATRSRPIFDADNHYWETSDAFTRHRDPEFAERGVRLVDVDGKGALRVRRRAAPSDHPRSRRRAHAPAAGRALRLLRGHERQGPSRQRAVLRGPGRASRVVRPRCAAAVHGRTGRRSGLAVPVAGRVHGRPDAARHRSLDPHPPGVQPVARRGLGLQLPEPDLRRAVPDALRRRPGGRGARLVPRARRAASSRSATDPRSRPRARSRRPIRCSTRSGRASPKRGVVVAPHAGFEDGYVEGHARRSPRSGVGRPASAATRSTSTRPSSRCS